MPANAVHGQYDFHQDTWRTLRDVMEGERAMKLGGVRYVPRLEGMNDVDFRAYVERGFFYNAAARTVSGYLGMIYRRDPLCKVPEGGGGLAAAMRAFVNDSDLLGKSLDGYSREVASEVIIMGRCGTLVDWVAGLENRAYFSFYRAEDIVNWREERIEGRLQLTLLVLREVVSVAGDDLFVQEKREQFRVLRLAASSSGGWECRVEIWGKGADARVETLVLLESVVPMRRGRPLPSIPFVFHGPNFSKPDVERSPISDIVAANLDHYRMMADFKHGMHYTALPTAWVAGFDKDAVLRIGSSTAWVTDQLGATAGYLEFRGEGLGTFERALDRVERLLAVLGARLLESQKRVSESAEALQLRQVGDSSVIAGICGAVSKSLTDAMRWIYWWNSTEEHPDEVTGCMVELNRDFDVVRLTGKEIQALVLAWQSSAISQDTLLHQFERGSVLPPGRDPDEERALILKYPPPVAPPTVLVQQAQAAAAQGGYG